MGAILKDLRLTEAGGSATELATVQEVKDYLQIEGTAYDTTLGLFITASREKIEKYCGVSLIERQAIATIHNTGYKPFELPYYPVTDILQVRWKKCPSSWQTLTTDEYDSFGNDRVFIESSEVGIHEVTYTLGQSDRPVFKMAIIAQAGFMFTNRDQSDKMAPEVAAMLKGVMYVG